MNNSASEYNKDNIHAEVDCVSKLKKSEKLAPINLIIFRTNNNADSLLMSKPCSQCVKTIHRTLKYKNYNLKKIWYTDSNGEFVRFY